MFRTVLIANRGEIACRIIRTCRRLGIRTVAVYSDADRGARHVAAADRALRIGGAHARDSYLRADAILDAARRSGADAVHPGYGFLSERTDLVDACVAAGIAFVGPSRSAIETMGDKIRSKQLAAAAGAPGVPGYDGDEQTAAALVARALAVGLPVMIKAAAGGGGKGIRRVDAPADLGNAIELARREALAAFGDGRLLIERCVLRPRHVEVQIAGDRHGNVIHLWERDCSVQRQHQKLIEEAPAPGLSTELRATLHHRALAVARAIAYDSLGTVEFLVEPATEQAYFLEMNTRLQVEHPVTEAITGLDLVELQLRSAAGERLALAQSAVRLDGHAIEVRLTAEDAAQGFRPDSGRIVAWQPPDGVRTDTGSTAGSEVSLHYDSLLAKLIAHGPTREAARGILADALDRCVALGVATTRAFLADALRSERFGNGDVSTAFIGEAFPSGWRPAPDDARRARALAVHAWLRNTSGNAGPWSTLVGHRLLAPAGGVGRARVHVECGDYAGEAGVEFTPDGVRVAEGDATLELAASPDARPDVVTIAGETCPAFVLADAGGAWVQVGAWDGYVRVRPAVDAALERAALGEDAATELRASMPGLIAAVHVAEGQAVQSGATLLTLESMKLFTDVRATRDGTVRRLHVRAGATVAAHALLVSLDPVEGT